MSILGGIIIVISLLGLLGSLTEESKAFNHDKPNTAIWLTGVVIGIVLLVLGQNSGSFEECMLDKMEGQDRSMISVAGTQCRKKYPYNESE